MKVTSKSQEQDSKEFLLKNIKKPFCYKETKSKYKLYEMPTFKSKFFKKKKLKNDLSEKCLFISGPARSGNHLLLSLLDNHPQIESEIGEDDMLRTIFSYVNISESEVLKKIKNSDLKYILNLSGQPKLGKGKGINKWEKLYKIYKGKKKINIWSGSQPEGEAHITDFQNMAPKINYPKFKNFFVKNKKKISKSKNFLEFFNLYLKAKSQLSCFKKKKLKESIDIDGLVQD